MVLLMSRIWNHLVDTEGRYFQRVLTVGSLGASTSKCSSLFNRNQGLKRVKGKIVLHICGLSLFSLTTHIYYRACCSSLIPDVIFHSLPTWTESQKISRKLPWLQHGIKTAGTSDFIDWTTTEFFVFHPNVHYWSSTPYYTRQCNNFPYIPSLPLEDPV